MIRKPTSFVTPTKEGLKPNKTMIKSSSRPLTVLWFGGGQDSTAILYLYTFSRYFREMYVGDSDFVVIMADTGNEFPKTYEHVHYIQRFCKAHRIEFHFIDKSKGFHAKTWQSLQGQFELNDNIMSVALPKSCSDKLKITVCYNFLEVLLSQKYGYSKTRKGNFYEYLRDFGRLKVIIGFAKGEESRRAEPSPDGKDPRPIYMQKTIQNEYPLIELGLDRMVCQNIITHFGFKVPIPSNCMMCPFQSDQELLYLNRFHPQMWNYWVEREAAKIKKSLHQTRNLGVKGSKLLPEVLQEAQRKYNHWTDEQLIEYRNSHGHCVKSKY